MTVSDSKQEAFLFILAALFLNSYRFFDIQHKRKTKKLFLNFQFKTSDYRIFVVVLFPDEGKLVQSLYIKNLHKTI